MHSEERPAGEESASVCRLAGVEDQWISLKNRMAIVLQPERVVHSLAVADESVAMGHCFGGDLVKLAFAGLLHDGAKELSAVELLAFAEAKALVADPSERENPSVLHGPVGAWIARSAWGIDDPIILESIHYHTTGESNMSLEACIVFMADLIEPGRRYTGVEVLRRLCREDLRAAMIEAIVQTFDYLERKKLPCHGGTQRCLAWLEKGRSISWKARN